MNIAFLIAGILTTLAFFLHTFGGEIGTFRKIDPETLPAIANGDGNITKQEIRMSWHGISSIFLINSIVLFLMTFTTLLENANTIAYFVALQMFAFAIVIAVVPISATRQASTLLRIPQWILCLVIAGLIYLGTFQV